MDLSELYSPNQSIAETTVMLAQPPSINRRRVWSTVLRVRLNAPFVLLDDASREHVESRPLTKEPAT